MERYDALNEGESQVTSVNGLQLDPSNDGKLLHFTASITNGGGLVKDPIFGVQTSALKLHRNAEMYQWQEHVKSTSVKNKTDGSFKTTNTYSWKKGWYGSLINSNNFKPCNCTEKHVNPTSMEFKSDGWMAGDIKIGAFDLPDRLKGEINWASPLSVGVDNITDATLRERAAPYNGGYYFGEGVTASSTIATAQDTIIVQSPSNPIRYWHVQHSELVESTDDVWTTFKMVQPGLTGAAGTISFEEEARPGYYLRHQNFVMESQADDASELFRNDATFFVDDPLGGGSNLGYNSFRSVNFPTHYITTSYDGLTYRLVISTGDEFTIQGEYWQESTFFIAPAVRPPLDDSNNGVRHLQTAPAIGDQKISFTETLPVTFSIVAVQSGNTLVAFVSETGEGGEVLLLKRVTTRQWSCSMRPRLATGQRLGPYALLDIS